jgi:diguanylate cyclase (GGDEF)-like protein
MFGYHFEELKGGVFSELYADQDQMERMLAVLRKQGYVRRYEMDMKRKDGSVFPSSLSISLLRNRAGEVDGSICMARDITETRKRMAQLNEVNKHLQDEILERERMEDAIQDTNEKLKSLVLEYGQHNQEITVLNEMSDMLQACLDCEEAHNAIAKFLPRLFPDESGAMYMLQNNQLTAVASWGDALATEPVFSPDACWALRLSEVHLVDGESPGLPCKHRSQELPGSTLCVPMTAQGATLGLLFLQVDRQPALVDSWEQPTASVSESKQRLAVTAAKQISLSIANLQLRDRLRRQALRDPLTGMYNRRYLDDTLERELLRAKRKNTTISIIMVDIDWFKSINDSFGHEAGDTVLTVVAKSLKNGVRGEDVVCRYGGEEFILVLPEASASSALERAEQLRQRIAQLEIEHEGRTLQKITASFGIASFPDHGQALEEVIKAADAAMYRAKLGGRNRVELA